jgi:hypothetical protein
VATHSITTALDLDTVRFNGLAVLASPLGLDTFQVQADTDSIINMGIFEFIASRQLSRRHLVVGPTAMQLVTPGTPLHDRLWAIVDSWNFWVYPVGYTPNCGNNFKIYGDEFSPHATIAAYFIRLQRAGKYLFLRGSF